MGKLLGLLTIMFGAILFISTPDDAVLMGLISGLIVGVGFTMMIFRAK